LPRFKDIYFVAGWEVSLLVLVLEYLFIAGPAVLILVKEHGKEHFEGGLVN
jgi:hypothetical protein